MYHAKDGLFFEVLPHGDVRVLVTLNGEHPKEGVGQQKNVYFETVLTRSMVASMMAFSCERGYNTQTFFDAYAFLQQPGATPTSN